MTGKRWTGKPLKRRPATPKQPVLCPRDLRPCRLINGEWVCDRHGPIPQEKP